MTTIAATKDEMACDLQFTHSGQQKFKGKTKVYKFNAHEDTYPECDFMIGFSGSASQVAYAAAFFANPDGHKKAPVLRGLQGLVLTAKKRLFVFDDLTAWLVVDQPYYAIGSGSPFALGALATGCTPKEAVEAAVKSDPFSGMGIKTYTFS